MTILAKHKFTFHRRYESDIWGVCFTDVRSNLISRFTGKKQLSTRIKSPYSKFFFKLWDRKKMFLDAKRQRYVYRLDMLPPDKSRKRFKARFLSIRMTRLFYLTFQDHQYRAIFKRASKKSGNVSDNYCSLIEGRSVMLVYRSTLVGNLFESIKLVKNGFVWTNDEQIYSIHAIILLGDFIRLISKYFRRFQYHVNLRARGKAILSNKPKFMFISYYFLMFYIFIQLRRQDLVYPVEVDMQRITGYY